MKHEDDVDLALADLSETVTEITAGGVERKTLDDGVLILQH
jgi:hypothetical protein